MGDFPAEWNWVRDLGEGGQGYIYVVCRSDGLDPKNYVLKRLKNLSRSDYFDREIRAYATLNHPSILKLVAHGKTPKGRPFLITEFCPEGSLDRRAKFDSPLDGLRFFEKVVSAIAYAHSRPEPVYHLDLKPQNILLKDSLPLVGDFGICFIEDDQLALTSEGPLGSKYYCAPELRGPRITGNPQLGSADVYSLGKILYWLFTGEVYDGHEDDYADPARLLSHVHPSEPQFAFIDDLIQKSVRRKPVDRCPNAVEFLRDVQNVLRRIAAGGRVPDLRIPQRCLYCAEGHYRAAHDEIQNLQSSYMARPYFPEIEKRRNHVDGGTEQSIYAAMRNAADRIFRTIRVGHHAVGIPLALICDHCGNVQYFRLDMTKDKIGVNWKP